LQGAKACDGSTYQIFERDDVGDKNVNVVGGVNHLALARRWSRWAGRRIPRHARLGAPWLDAAKATVDGVVVEIVFVRVRGCENRGHEESLL